MLSLIFGIVAILFALLNIYSYLRKKNNRWYGFISLSMTALTASALYSAEASRVIDEDWIGLMDIMPVMSKFLWICVISSIVINFIPLLNTKDKQ